MKHVLAIVPSLRMGGAEIQALRNCEALLGAGYQVTLVTIFRVHGAFYAPYLAALQARGLRFHALLDQEVPLTPQGPRHFASVLVKAVARLRALYDELRPDLVYTRLWYASLVAWVTRAIAHHRPVLVFNEESRFQGGFKGWARLFLMRRAGTWVVPCQGLFDEAVALGTPAGSGRVLPNIVDGPVPGGARPGNGPLRLAFLGRLEPAKGLDRLLDVASRLRGVAFDLQLAGSGSLEGEVRAAIERQGLEGKVRLVGPVSDLAAFFGGVDLLLLTSHYEGFANVIVEANAYGVPVLAMRVPHGPADIIREGRNGFLVPNGDVAGMVARLAHLTRAELATMRGACQAIAEEHYSVRSQQARWQALVEVAC
ncbi:MAG: glycosyl transferase [Cyanobacteria bacterium RYN_339]|nr:glycosyl transferase [Cyanobacteria bacterium RYN_339]